MVALFPSPLVGEGRGEGVAMCTPTLVPPPPVKGEDNVWYGFLVYGRLLVMKDFLEFEI